MSGLAEVVEISHRNVRAVNIEDDLGVVESLHGYSSGAHIIDALRRIAAGMQDGARSRAWSLTGPYGAGKSSFALFLCALLSPSESNTYTTAEARLRVVDPQLADTIAAARKQLDIESHGIIPAVTVATREPAVRALMRALLLGVQERTARERRKPSCLAELRKAVTDERSDPELLMRVVEEISGLGPLVIIVDELGKTLEYAAERSSQGDLYVLQQLAERFSSASKCRGAIITLQHLAFEDYLVGAGEARRREWRKIHGRFEDLPFISDRSHALRLLADSISPIKREGTAYTRLVRQAKAAERALAEVAPHMPLPSAATESSEALYPLHPLAALVLPVLASRFGQHDRSLVAFLAGDAPGSLSRFLKNHTDNESPVPFLRVADLYDFLFADGGAAASTGAEGARAREIQARVDRVGDLHELSLETLKTAAVLNLAGDSTGLIASETLIVEAIVGPQKSTELRHAVKVALDGLVEKSLLTYRGFADEFRVWEGSDFDIAGAAMAARERITLDDPEELILSTVRSSYGARPAVAQRHSQERHVLRFFESRLAMEQEIHEAHCVLDGADGLVLSIIADGPAPKSVPSKTADGRPLIVVWSPHGLEIREVALDVAAALAVMEAPELETDYVARREVRHRLTTVQSALADRVEEAFDPGRGDVRWFVRGKSRLAKRPREFSELLSEICDERYPQTPIIRNEMINRSELTSQGSKARRTLIELMFTSEGQERLGIEGYGPERAMYESALAHTGLHAERASGLGFGPPPARSDLADVWDAIMSFFDGCSERRRSVDELYGLLTAPPFGLKLGPVPLLLVAALQYRCEDVFLYQDGTFQPSVDSAHIERLLKTPERFAVKRAALVGLRGEVFEQLRSLVGSERDVGVKTRNTSTLTVVRPLVSFAGALPEYTKTTESISDQARSVCRSLLDATEPDELLFRDLPQACGQAAISAIKRASEPEAQEFVVRLRHSLAELGSAYERLLDRIAELLLHGFSPEISRSRMREDLRARSLRLAGNVIEPKLRAFLLTAADEQLEENEWLEALAMTLSSKPPGSWTDHDVVVFEALVAERARWFHRLELLHFEMLSRADGGFDACKITLTSPDGSEHQELVSIDVATQEVVGEELSKALENLEKVLVGGQAPKALLGALVTRLLTDTAAPAATVGIEAAGKPGRARRQQA